MNAIFLPALAGHLLRGWRTWRRQQQDEAEIARLDEHSLRDIGLSRSELASCFAEARDEVERSRLRIAHRPFHHGCL